MPDTLIEEPIRPTVTDDLAAPEGDPAEAPGAAPAEARPAPPGEGAPAAPQRPGRPRGAACLVLAIAIAALLAGAALCVYLFFWRYVPTARQHIPGDANIVVRLETADLALFGPVRRHFLPLLDDAPQTASRKARIEAATGLDFPSDLREIVVASTDATSWVALAGGRIPKGRFVAGMEKVARDEGWAGVRREGELLLIGPRAVLGQADDGTLVLGTDAEIVRAALPASDEWRRLDLPEQGAVTFALTSAAWSGAATAASRVLPRAGALFRRINHASGTLALGAEPALSMRLAPASGEAAAALAPDTQALLGSLKLALAVLPGAVDVVGAGAALEGAQALAQGELVEIRTKWPYEGLDRACAELAHRARAARDAAGAAPGAAAGATP
ncbi:hypothetical protein [Sorangium atrum]|uniref:DUF2125 domain-containing protein n=1 Tax=Sorangium atrum TaxID=2995308 RepID=A0ABT5CIX8_9BACT|nr:hypothetical protein [Sorangium aterium]MDC0685908.1 hypothetical protein [Sorangium aterium]